MNTVTNLNSNVYYQGLYWNDFDIVTKYMNHSFTGNKNISWFSDFSARFKNTPFQHALFLNCGDGRHERKFIRYKLVKKVTAFDISKNLLKKAQEKAKGLNINYVQSDINTIDFKPNTFDLVVNIASLHHTQYINRTMYQISKCLKPDGIFLSFDYIGPHRNQYPKSQWQITKKVNNTLPKNFRKDLQYPHLPTMMITDPTEAIHSELILNTAQKYFTFLHNKSVGGGIAYEIFTHNKNITRTIVNKNLQIFNHILTLDKRYSEKGLIPYMFNYFIAIPNKTILENKKQIIKNEQNEICRELFAEILENTYSEKEFRVLLDHRKTSLRLERLVIFKCCKFISLFLPDMSVIYLLRFANNVINLSKSASSLLRNSLSKLK